MIDINDPRKFSIDEWYPIFKNVALETVIFQIGPELKQKLEQDSCDTNMEGVCSPEYINEIEDAIRSFSNEAFVKNNWHAPIDAKFISFGNSLKVTCFEDVITYLNASDIVMNDFNMRDTNFCIALRPWMNIHPASEFRCIVINGVLKGITSRDWLTYYPHFQEESVQIVETIKKFFDNHIKGKFPVKTYTFDVVLNENEVHLMDFGALNSRAKLYSFRWDEIQPLLTKANSEEVAPVFRFIDSDVGILPSFLKHRMHVV